jgi:Rhodanese-like domain
MENEKQMRCKVNQRNQFTFLALIICLSIACNNNTPPPPNTSSTPAAPRRAAAPPASGHDHSTHELENKMPRISAEELKRLVGTGQAVIVDVRSPEDYQRAHIQGAINLPVQVIEAGQYPRFPRDKRLISYCT